MRFIQLTTLLVARLARFVLLHAGSGSLFPAFSHVFCSLFLAFLHAFARSFGKRLLLEKAGNLHHTPLFSFSSPLVFRVSNAVKKYILSHLLYFGFIDSIVRVGAETSTI